MWIFLICLMPSFFLMTAKEEYVLPFYPPYYSQCGQDKYLHEHIFKNQRKGVFVEIGAHDGITRSNTYFFEKNLDWFGICIEPHPDRYEELLVNRSSKTVCLPCAVANYTGKMSFLKISGYAEMLSGLEQCYDQKHQARITEELKKFGGSKELINVNVAKLSGVLDEYGIAKLDLLSIDTEGSELDILQSIDFNKVAIRVIIVENNYKNLAIFNYLTAQGYTKQITIDSDEIYIKQV